MLRPALHPYMFQYCVPVIYQCDCIYTYVYYSCVTITTAVNTAWLISYIQLFNFLCTAAPQPSFHTDTISAPYGSNVTLTCAIDVANPSPSYYWEHLSGEDISLRISMIFNDGSLLLKNVQKSGIYRCTASNGYGSSIQIIQLSKFECICIATYAFIRFY